MIVPPLCRIPDVSSQPSGFRFAVDHPAPAVQDAERLVPVLPEPPADGADDGVEAGQSPPPVSIPIRIEPSLASRRGGIAGTVFGYIR